VREALTVLAEATADLDRSSSRITLHIGSSFASKWLMPRMSAFSARFPDVALTTEIHDTVLERNLGRNEIAIWPATQVAPKPAHQIQRLCALDLVAVCSPDFQRSGDPVDTETLLSLPLLQDANRRWERLIADTGYQGIRNILNFDRSALALEAAIQGHGVAIAPGFMIDGDMHARRLVEIWRNPKPSGEYLFLAWPKHHAREVPLKQTVAWILSEFGVDSEALE
jgi:LysR family glycine cleavage system transcriptional activator